MVSWKSVDYEKVFLRYDKKVETEVTPEELFDQLAPSEEPWKSMAENIVFLDTDAMEDDVKDALETETPEDIIEKGLIGGMEVVSELYDRGIYYLPQIIMAAEAMGKGIELCEDVMAEEGREREAEGKVVMHAAEGDPHDIGKDIAAAMLKAAGYEIIDLGRDVPVEEVADCVEEEDPDLLTGTALMTTTQTAFPRVSKELKERDLEDTPFIGAGGAVNSAFVHSYDTGIYAAEASDGPAIADAICKDGLSWQEIREEYDEIVPSSA